MPLKYVSEVDKIITFNNEIQRDAKLYGNSAMQTKYESLYQKVVDLVDLIWPE